MELASEKSFHAKELAGCYEELSLRLSFYGILEEVHFLLHVQDSLFWFLKTDV